MPNIMQCRAEIWHTIGKKYLLWVMLGIELRNVYTWGRSLITRLHPQPTKKLLHPRLKHAYQGIGTGIQSDWLTPTSFEWMNEWSGQTKFCMFFFSNFNSGLHGPLNTGGTTFVPNLGLLWVVRFMSCFLASLVLPRYWLYDRVYGNFHIIKLYTVISSWIISAFAHPKLLIFFHQRAVTQHLFSSSHLFLRGGGRWKERKEFLKTFWFQGFLETELIMVIWFMLFEFSKSSAIENYHYKFGTTKEENTTVWCCES